MSQAPTTSPHTLAVFVGGLGTNQFAVSDGEWSRSLIQRAEVLPGVKVLRIDDPFKSDIVPAIVKALEKFGLLRVVVISHSRGWYAAAEACRRSTVDFFIACDPAWADWSVRAWPMLPSNRRQPGAFFKASDFGVPCSTQLNIQNGPEIQILGGASEPLAGNHNTCTREPAFIESVLTYLESPNATRDGTKEAR